MVSLPIAAGVVRSSITAGVAREIADAYTDQIIFPDRVQVDLPEASNRRFPGWATAVLVISVENQGVCAWGVPLGEENPPVLVGGDICTPSGPVRGTMVQRPERNRRPGTRSRRWLSGRGEQRGVAPGYCAISASLLGQGRLRCSARPRSRSLRQSSRAGVTSCSC